MEDAKNGEKRRDKWNEGQKDGKRQEETRRLIDRCTEGLRKSGRAMEKRRKKGKALRMDNGLEGQWERESRSGGLIGM